MFIGTFFDSLKVLGTVVREEVSAAEVTITDSSGETIRWCFLIRGQSSDLIADFQR